MDSDQGKLFIGGISWETNEDRLKDYFGNYGEVLQTVIMRDKISGRPRGFGFVVFADPSVLDRVLQDKHVLDGRTVEAKRALSREEQQTSSRTGNVNNARTFGSGGNYRTKKIFVGGLPPTLSEEEFRQYFEAYGNVTDVVVMYDQQTQRPRGFGFISFDSEDAVDRVLHKTFHDLNGKQVEVKRALPKDANLGGGGRSMGGGAGAGGGGAGGGGYQGYGGSGGNSGSYDGRVDSSRYMQSQNTGGGFAPFGSSGYNAPGYGYGPANNSMGYSSYGGYGGANPGYGGPASTGYGNPNAPSAGYGSGPPGAARSSWSSQAPSGYGAVGYQNAAPWGAPNASGGGPGSAPTGQSPGGAAGYGNQNYAGGYSDGFYGSQAVYGAVGGRAGSVPNSNASAGGGELQGTGGGYMGGSYGDSNGNSGYGSQGWRSDPSQTSGSYGGQGNGPHGGQVGYGGGYGGAPARQAQQQ
ncbi:heterogeneous nuclear ribonucleoprotein 1-like [Actinidia eriantha]|uniref:heterogeneous nuclear ribonucleoprotein 1-like n=1 Tax=Actinidia eriantha TaxID=165200 RepID=UPI00258C293F|nr:heterogeneous nuclear ribonucleoprotein 1-like [Actinidia eriantha]